MKTILMIIMVGLLLAGGCMTAKQREGQELKRAIRLNKIFDQNPEWSWAVRDSIMNEQIRLGMTKEQVVLSLGFPPKYPYGISRTITTFGVTEVWPYDVGYGGPWLYFDDGILTGWSE